MFQRICAQSAARVSFWNILVIGGTNRGKTTFVNAVREALPRNAHARYSVDLSCDQQ